MEVLRTLSIKNSARNCTSEIRGLMDMPDPSTSNTPLPARIRLSHAYFQNFANANKIDLLHVKGYAFGEEVYRRGRTSSDVDLLVRPAHIPRFLYLLKKDGWQTLATFETGSVFEHATTLYHPSWGLTDIHRYFPGMGFEDPEIAFERLWRKRRSKEIAHFPCWVPDLVDARNIVVIHGARVQSSTITSEILYLQESLTDADWQQMRARMAEFGSLIAFDTALGRIEEHRDNKYYLFWKSASQQVPAPLQWYARLQRASGLKKRLGVLRNILLVNEDHLAMHLGHEPSSEEKRVQFFERFKKMLGKGRS